MIQKKLFIALGLSLITLTTSSHSAITWTGLSATDSTDFFDDTNWDGSAFNGGTVALDNLIISNDNTIMAGSSFDLGGFNLSLTTGSSVTTTGSRGINNGSITLLDGSLVSSQFFSAGLLASIDATSSIILRGTGDPINSQTTQSRVTLAVGGQLTFSNTAELADQLNDSGTGDIFVNSERVTSANATSLLNTSDNLSYTAVPEPSSSALLGLGGLALLLRRRK